MQPYKKSSPEPKKRFFNFGVDNLAIFLVIGKRRRWRCWTGHAYRTPASPAISTLKNNKYQRRIFCVDVALLIDWALQYYLEAALISHHT